MHNSTIERFINHANLQTAPIMARQYYIGTRIEDGAAILEYRLPEAITISELLDALDDHMELVILYHVIPTEATVMGEQCCAYSDTACEYIYKVNGMTDDSGKCDTIYVTLYTSLETLGVEVLAELQRQTSNSHEIVYSRQQNEVLRDFIR